MLYSLNIQNYALIQNLDIEFKSGLDIITGETGTGKSILLGAMGLILGNRIDSSSVLNPDKKCVVEGRFILNKHDNFLEAFFKKYDLDQEDFTILRREISPNGKSRAFINDTPVNLAILKELAENIVDIHSQRQTFQLASFAFQMGLLDSFAGHRNLLDKYSRTYKQYKRLNKEMAELQEQATNAKKEYDYHIFQLNEIQKANLQPNEMENLDEELLLLSNAENIKQNLNNAMVEISDDETSINSRLANVKKLISPLASLNPKLHIIFNRLEDVLIETKDIYQEIEEFQESVSFDSNRLESVNSRLEIINRLLNKHQFKTEIELINFGDQLLDKIKSTESMTGQIEDIKLSVNAIELELTEMANEISTNRLSQINYLEDSLITLLKQVGIPEAVIKIDLYNIGKLNDFGKDEIDILFSANKGSKPMSISQVASGGELSRLMLCFKYLLADNIFLPTIIFDEIDTGISGEVAIKVGGMIKKLSENHQVICITHLPQVAALADHHYIVYKISGEEITLTNIRQINKEERIEEIAKMIGGHQPSLIAIENAKELLNR